ncbi:ABC transporter permease [Coxiella burnetii]|uniref:ABC transporter permease n=1 Tax=Coxiella burnetii TaxID=777 RepID=UPI0000ED014B|nr:ABC transporter permease [Coxiella burnetii]ACJ20710.1 O-antigen export system permease protein [Coxiella burnetii CbuK_Q154]AIT63785.1 O-antigen export system permease protein [Coxiella burnetii str. Namibia]ATN86301.1 sugar ABC transporter permease [Coxiella burnetii str. Schperling]EAX33320.1 sugar ABC transporter permease [Coxiella burnetii 'MSU Goat Q177']EDR36445.1 putative lipopolysaccharide/O-antigen ABC transporter, permease protein [Coxiella burnetii Q321]
MNDVTDQLVQDLAEPIITIDKKHLPVFIGAQDYFKGFKKWNLWLYMAYAEIRRRYKRTLIGPFWATLSIAIFIGSMGFLLATLWHREIRSYLPFFASSYVVWIFFSTTLSESCTTFIANESYMKQIALPYSFYAFLVVSRNVMVFFHHFVVFLTVALIFHLHITHNTWLVIPGFALLILNCSWIATALGLVCARVRDIQQIVTSILQIAMFITPIFWSESQLGHGKIALLIINLNPIYHFISVVRYPLMGEPASLVSWMANILILVVGWTFTMVYLGRNYNKLIYWL